MNVRAETVSELFADLNELRRINDKPALKSWKDSKAKLLAAIAKEEAEGLAPAPKAKKMTSGASPVKAIDTDALTKAIEENKKANAKIAAPKTMKVIQNDAGQKASKKAFDKAAKFVKNNVDQVKTPKAVKSVKVAKKSDDAVNVSAICKQRFVARTSIARMKLPFGLR